MWPTKEQQFILSFLRASLGYEHLEKTMSILSEGLDWDPVVAMASYHGIVPLFYDFLTRNQQLHLPPKVVEFLAKEHLANAALSLFYAKALKAIISHLQQNDLPFVVHKGLGLAALLYDQPELRPCGGDFDLLVKKEDYSRAKALLEEMGYCLMNPLYEQHELDYIGEVKLVRHLSGKKLIIDLHTDFNANHWGKVSEFAVESFWENLLSVPYHDFYIPSLPLETNLFFLAIHCAANHIFHRLITFCDLDLLIRKYGDILDWKYIAHYAKEHYCTKALYHSLNYCKLLLGTPVPPHFLGDIKPTSLSIFFHPTRLLLLRGKKPPKRLERYLHILLLDNPFYFFRSIAIFLRRIYSEWLIKRKSGVSMA